MSGGCGGCQGGELCAVADALLVELVCAWREKTIRRARLAVGCVWRAPLRDCDSRGGYERARGLHVAYERLLVVVQG